MSSTDPRVSFYGYIISKHWETLINWYNKEVGTKFSRKKIVGIHFSRQNCYSLAKILVTFCRFFLPMRYGQNSHENQIM